MLDRTLLATLAAVLRTGSFDRAAAALGVTPPAVSQRIKTLEDHVGTALILRTTPCRPTAAGERLARHAEEVALLEHDLSCDLGLATSGAETRVRLAINADSLATWFLSALTHVRDLRYDLVVDDQDHSSDWLRRGEVAAAVTGEAAPVAGCDVTPLGPLRYRAVASPGFAAQHFGKGLTREAFETAPALLYDTKDRLQHRWAAQVSGAEVALSGHHIPSTHGFLTAARLGLGWGMNPAALVVGQIAAGELVDLAPHLPLDVALFWQVRRSTAKALTALTKAVRRASEA